MQSKGQLKSGSIVPWALLLFWTAMMVVADLVSIGTTWRQHEANFFATTPGKIAQSGLGQGALGRRGLRLRYTYVVNGVKYAGSRYRYDDGHVSLRYDKVVNEFVAHSVHTIYYNPNNPRDAVLSPGVDGCDVLLVLVAVPFNVVTLAVWPAMLERRRARKLSNRFSGFKVMRDKSGLTVRFAAVSAVEAGLYGLAIAATIESSVVILRWGFTESISLMVGIWAADLAVGAAAAAWMHVRNISGTYDLRIDTESRAVILPSSAGHGVRRKVGLDSVLGVAALRRVIKTRSGSCERFVPSVILAAGAEGGRELAPLVTWGWGESRAVVFGSWLARELRVEFQGIQDEGVSLEASQVMATA